MISYYKQRRVFFGIGSWVQIPPSALRGVLCLYGVFNGFFLAASVSSRGAPEQQIGQKRCGRLWWSWVQLRDSFFCFLFVVWRVSLFVAILGSNPIQRACGVLSLLRGCLCFVLMKPG